MAKKSLFILVLAVLITTGVSAQSALRFSAGAGGYLTRDFGGGVEASVLDIIDGYIKTPYTGGGGFIFFDAAFFEVSLGLTGIYGKWESSVDGFGTASLDTSGTGLDIGLTVKLPISLNSRLTVFPLLGVTYRAVLSAELDGNGYETPDDFTVLWYKIGGGLDFSLTDNIYIRLGVSYGLRQANKYEKEAAESLESPFTDVKILHGQGLDVKLAVGYRF